jgi:signal transduction histidine kinase
MRRRVEVEIFLQQMGVMVAPATTGIVSGMGVDKFWRPWRLSLGVHILALLLGGLIVAQAVTVALTVLLPPDHRPQYGLDDIAAVLEGSPTHGHYSRPLQRVIQTNRPTIAAPGWLVSESSQQELAALLGKGESELLVYFYTPPPFAGTVNLPMRESALQFPTRESALDPSFPVESMSGARGRKAKSSIILAEFAMPPQGFPGGVSAGGAPGPGNPPGGFSHTPTPGIGLIGRPGREAPFGGGALGSRGVIIDDTRSAATPPTFAPPPDAPPSNAQIQGPDNGDLLVRSQYAPEFGVPAPSISAAPAINVPPPSPSVGHNALTPAPAADHAEFSSRAGPMQMAPVAPPPRPSAIVTPKPAIQARPPTSSDLPTPMVETSVKSALDTSRGLSAAGPSPPISEIPPLKLSPVSRTAVLASNPPRTETIADMNVPGFGAAPFIQGDFVAALKLDENHWAVVRPMAESFPNSWQRRVLLWFLVSFALVAPFGWLFARRVVRPIAGFADAAEQLGRDPRAPILALDGPSEIGRAAHAFNRMQNRLRSFVDDRTAMMGAISHDLRTPLTRMRFRLEDAPDDIRVGMEHEVAEMEAMINSVLAFIRDASEPGVRERLDLRTIVEDVVEDAVFVGNDVTLEHSEAASVEVDVLGMRRLLANLVENAVKYGEHARVRLFRDHNDAIAEISDDGPGLPEDELERVFQPFYRGANARSSKKDGNGLGLAVCRSIARAHGGDVRLIRSAQGFVAQLRVPLAELQG